MYWNHRVMRRTSDKETFDAIYEVYYRDDGKVEGWTQEPTYPMATIVAYGEKVDDPSESLENDIRRFLEALDKPMLDWETGQEI